jgi:hypothetical protein
MELGAGRGGDFKGFATERVDLDHRRVERASVFSIEEESNINVGGMNLNSEPCI